jgi:hypothetical protein
MKSLNDVFAQFSGLAHAGPPAAKIDVDRLKTDLAEVERRNRFVLRTCIGMIGFLFLTLIGIVVFSLHNPAAVQVAVGAFGVSCAGLIRWMMAIWREKYYLEILLTLANNLEAKDLREALYFLRARWLGQKWLAASGHRGDAAGPPVPLGR